MQPLSKWAYIAKFQQGYTEWFTQYRLCMLVIPVGLMRKYATQSRIIIIIILYSTVKMQDLLYCIGL